MECVVKAAVQEHELSDTLTVICCLCLNTLYRIYVTLTVSKLRICIFFYICREGFYYPQIPLERAFINRVNVILCLEGVFNCCLK